MEDLFGGVKEGCLSDSTRLHRRGGPELGATLTWTCVEHVGHRRALVGGLLEPAVVSWSPQGPELLSSRGW